MKNYRKTHNYRKVHRYKRKKSIFRNRFFWLGTLIIIFITFFSYFLFFSNFFKIEKVIVTGEKKVLKEDIISFVPVKNIFLIDLKGIRENILDKFPQIAEVEIKRAFPDTLNVVVIERLEIANWCQNEQCFLLDNEGVIFEQVLPETDLIKIVDEQNTNPFILGEKVIEKESLSQIFDIEPKLKLDLKIPVKEFKIISKEKLTVVTVDSWEIHLNLQEGIGWQLTKLNAVLEEKIPSEKRKDLEYIELRFGNFAPFKYKDY